MKTAFSIGLAGAALLCSLGAWAADYTMRISHQFPPTHQTARALDQFAADVKASTGGKVEVQIFGAEQLFKANQQHAAVARGQVEAAAIVSFGWGGTIPEMNVMTIPFLMTHAGQLKKFPTSDAARLLDEKMAAKGVKNIAWLVDANDAIVTSAKAPLLKPEDFKGVKIRGISKLFDNGLTAMGASPSAMPGSEVYQALQTGVIDAGITSCAAAYSRRYYEVQKFGVASAMLTAYETLVVNPAWWEKLPADLQKNLMAAAHKAEATLLPTSDEVAPEDVKRLRDKGMQVTVLTKEQEKALAAVMQPPVIKAFGESSPDGAKLIGMIQTL
jgi:C4-dicarboxylate-binding protein DctP